MGEHFGTGDKRGGCGRGHQRGGAECTVGRGLDGGLSWGGAYRGAWSGRGLSGGSWAGPCVGRARRVGTGSAGGAAGAGTGAGTGRFSGSAGPELGRDGPWRARNGARCLRTACAAARPRRSGAGSAAGPPPPPASCPHSWALWCPRCSPCSASSSSCASVSAAAPRAPLAPGRGPGPLESHQLCLVPPARPPSNPGAPASGAPSHPVWVASALPVPSPGPPSLLQSQCSPPVHTPVPTVWGPRAFPLPAQFLDRAGVPVLCVPT